VVPELIVPFVKEVVVEAVERKLGIIVQGLVRIVELGRNPWMVGIFFPRLRNKEHVGCKIQQAVAQDTVFFGVFQGTEMKCNLPLGGKSLLQMVTSGVFSRIQVFFSDKVCLIPEYSEQNIICNIRHYHPVLVKDKTPLTNLLCRHWHGGIKITHQTLCLLFWNGPYPEEAKNMVNTVGIKVTCHISKPVLPPGISVLFHDFPVICRKAPVLALHRKFIGRSASLCIHME